MERLYTLKEAKKLLGVQTKTIQRWDKESIIKVIRTPGGRRRIPESEILRLQGNEKRERIVIGYARVSSLSQKDDLERQKVLIKSKGVNEILTDIGSGLNEKRRNYKKLLRMVTQRKIEKIVITYPDRLTRFGFETLKEFFSTFGAEIEVINEDVYTSPHEEMVKDMITIIAHFSGKLYGMRSHKQREIIKNAKNIFTQT
jgi:putative resolvase